MKISVKNIDPDQHMLLNLNTFIHHENKMFEYHMKHIMLVKEYAIIINHRLNAHIDDRKLGYIALSHDLFKERSLNPKKDSIWNGHVIPQDTTRYVRSNLELLEMYGLDEFFNTSIQYHPLSAGLFLMKELGIKDEEILYPVMMHSCPIIQVYQQLSPKIRTMIDIIMLADKLSSNYLRINYREVEVKIDLDKAVFGIRGNEFNYTLGLYLARLIGQGKSIEKQSKISTEYYYKRIHDMNPLISVKKLGGNILCPKRKSQILKTQLNSLNPSW